jgi:hypothetical protein
MTAEKLEKKDKEKGKEPKEITFRCQNCEKYKPLEDMRTVTRFFPPMVLCQDCEKEMH